MRTARTWISPSTPRGHVYVVDTVRLEILVFAPVA
jgi:hypothetical protein